MEVYQNTTNNTLARDGFHTGTGKGIRFVIMLLVSITVIVSNLINMIILRTVKEIPKLSRIFLTNLSVADFSVGFFVCLPSVVSALTGNWPYGAIWCQISALIYGSSSGLSVWTLAFVSIERYLAVVHPHKYRNGLTRKQCLLTILLMWVTAISAFFWPCFTKPDFIYFRFSDVHVLCGFHWEYPWFQIATAIIFPYISGCCILFCTNRTIKTLRRTNPSRAVTAVGDNGNRHKGEKAIRLIVLTAVGYFLLYSPYCVVGGIKVYVTNGQNLVSSWAEFISVWIMNCNCFTNVVIYSGIYPSFRRRFRGLLCKALACSTLHNPAEGLSQVSTLSTGQTMSTE